MADTGIFATTAQVQAKAGANASTVSNVEAYINDYMLQAESVINARTRFNWSDVYAALDADVKSILTSTASAWAAMKVISYDMAGFTSRGEAEDMLNLLDADFKLGLQLLKERAQQDFINGA